MNIIIAKKDYYYYEIIWLKIFIYLKTSTDFQKKKKPKKNIKFKY